ncbi:poly-beta-1,6-N-acetyl-D-glucosamine N-deacetylase PgaB [Candidatus Bealeia paramacronuclearis]
MIFLCINNETALKAFENNNFIILSYHNITDQVTTDNFQQSGEDYSLPAQQLTAQFQWLSENGYTVISMDDVLQAKRGEKTLPEKAVLLSFDDGYQSFYQEAFPLLKAFNYPAVLGIVGSWIEVPEGQDVKYEEKKKIPRDKLMTWEEIKEVQDSGLIEIANHSYALHKGIPGNPQKNLEPAIATHQYLPNLGKYESDHAYLKRVHEDLKKNSDLFHQRLGKKPRIMIWPYGATNMKVVKIAHDLEMPITFTLEDKINTVDNLTLCGRKLAMSFTTLGDFIIDIYDLSHPPLDPFRTVRVDLDYVYDPDPKIQEENLSKLVQRIYEMQISAVILQAYADPDGSGNIKEVYFPNRHLPMRTDLLNRLTWQLRTRAGVEVFVWIPMLAFDINREDLLVKSYDPQSAKLYVDKERYRRLSPFHPKSQKIIHEIYEDLSKSSFFAGIAYHDDGVLSDFEDANDFAFQEFLRDSHLEITLSEAIQNPEYRKAWASWKTQKLIDFTKSLTETVKIYNPFVKTMRSLFALPILNPDSEEWFSQNFDSFLKTYDYTAIMAMPYMEGADDPEGWMNDLVEKVKNHPEGLKKSLFELQSVNWRTKKLISTEEIVKWMQNLQVRKAINFGYYPDDFHQDHPQADIVHRGISKQNYPFRL